MGGVDVVGLVYVYVYVAKEGWALQILGIYAYMCSHEMI